MRTTGWTAGLMLAASWPVVAQAAPADNPQVSALINGVRDAAHEAPLQVGQLDLTVDVAGAVAQVTVDATFLNPGHGVLEGEFRYALPPGAVVTGYALDLGGAMIDGVLVDRPRAKAVFDARVRRGVDPGLAEVLPDNLFVTRVHPILPGRGRHIRLRYAVAMPADGLHLPLAIAAPAQGWSISVHLAEGTATPVVILPDGSKARFEHTADGAIAHSEGHGSALAGELAISRPDPAPITLTHGFGESAMQLAGDLPAAPSVPGGRLRVYWDRSRARLAGHLDDDLALLRQVIARAQPAAIELVAFNSSGAQRHSVATADEAMAWLGTLAYRGATSFAALAGDAPTDRCLVFVNGPASVDLATGFAPPCRTDAIASAPAADLGWLRHVAQSLGGSAYRLTPGQLDSLAQTLTAGFAGVVAVHDRDGRALPFVPLEATPGHWLILARAPYAGPVTVALAGAAAHEEQRMVPAEGAEFAAPASLLAADRLADLTAPAQREDYVALSRRYGIASPSLSFLVLETPQDYIAARIDPPAGFPAEWRDDYARWRKAGEAAHAGAMAQRLEQVVGLWQEQDAWWKTRFNPAAQPKRVTTSDRFDRTEPMPAPPPPPPPPPAVMAAPPPAVMAPPAAAPTVSGNVVVTAMRRQSAQADDSAAPIATDEPDTRPHIQIDAWQPERPYLELYDGKPADFDARFVEAEARHGSLPIFYLDTAEWLRRHGQTAAAAEMVLSALALPTANEVTLGIVADRLERYGAIDRAVELRERAAALDPDRPQPRRLLALALIHRAALQPAHARDDLARAIALLYAIAITPQDPAWDGIELIALNEANAVLPRLRQLGGSAALDPRLIGRHDVDLRVVIDWTSDGSDMDLWVDEPDHERAIYNNPRTAIGGRLSHDMTRGYGPEEYQLRHAPAGTYSVHANVFAPDRIDPNGATLLTAHLFRDFGRPTQREESVDVELKRDEQGARMIGTIEVGAK